MYSSGAGVAYIFNLIVGTGALALPKAVAGAGWLISIIFLLLLGSLSYITTTFVIESLSIANACYRRDKSDDLPDSFVNGIKEERSHKSPSVTRRDARTEKDPLLGDKDGCYRNSKWRKCSNQSHQSIPINSMDDNFEITRNIEMGEMAIMFFNKFGRIAFYICIIVYLYGDLAIYAVAVPKSMRDIACASISCNSSNLNHSKSEICWKGGYSRDDVYRIFLAVFTLFLAPFAYFNVQKTKYLQYFTTLLRWIAFIVMIVLALLLIVNNKEKGIIRKPSIANFNELPNLFGVSVYSFMCQHSLPSLVTPIKNKKKLKWLLFFDYILIFGFYALLSLTAVFAFDSDTIQDIYTLNFQDSCEATDITFLRYFLGLFPVFTISTNFPIIAVTLTNNLKALFSSVSSSSLFFNRILFPTLAIVPPIAAAFVTNDITSLVGYTGSYAGAGVQYVIPATLVLMARKHGAVLYGDSAIKENQYKSPFFKRIWIIILLLWTVVCITFLTVNHILSHH